MQQLFDHDLWNVLWFTSLYYSALVLYMLQKVMKLLLHVVYIWLDTTAVFFAPLQQNSHIAKPPSCYYVNCLKAAGWCHNKLGTTCGCSALPFLS